MENLILLCKSVNFKKTVILIHLALVLLFTMYAGRYVKNVTTFYLSNIKTHSTEKGGTKSEGREKIRKAILTKVGTSRHSMNGRCNECFHWEGPIIWSPPMDFCGKGQNQLTLFIIVISHPASKIRRANFRDLYLSNKSTKEVQVMFAFGKSTLSYENQLLEEESQKYGDVIQFGVKDSYRNHTYIVFNALKWVANKCPSVKFIGKVSDDVYLNVQNIIEVLNDNSLQLQDVLFGRCFEEEKPVFRKPGHLYETTIKEYPFTTYPTHCSGASLFASSETMSKLMDHASNIRFNPKHDDVNLGILAQFSRTPLCNLKGFYFIEKHGYWNTRQNQKFNCKILPWRDILILHMHKFNEKELTEIAECTYMFKAPDLSKEHCLNSKIFTPHEHFMKI